jgi:hypothetical protein
MIDNEVYDELIDYDFECDYTLVLENYKRKHNSPSIEVFSWKEIMVELLFEEEVSEWLNSNCQSVYKITSNQFLFESDQDHMNFVLVWGL